MIYTSIIYKYYTIYVIYIYIILFMYINIILIILLKFFFLNIKSIWTSSIWLVVGSENVLVHCSLVQIDNSTWKHLGKHNPREIQRSEAVVIVRATIISLYSCPILSLQWHRSSPLVLWITPTTTLSPFP